MTIRVFILLFIGLGLWSSRSVADDDAERARLARIAKEIDALAPLIRDARGQADPEARVRFDYGRLRHDLATVRAGLRDYLNAARRTPRTIPPLDGEYGDLR